MLESLMVVSRATNWHEGWRFFVTDVILNDDPFIRNEQYKFLGEKSKIKNLEDLKYIFRHGNRENLNGNFSLKENIPLIYLKGKRMSLFKPNKTLIELATKFTTRKDVVPVKKNEISKPKRNILLI